MTARDIRPVDSGAATRASDAPRFEDVYAELRRLAAGYIRRERAVSVRATDLVHDAYLRLASGAPAPVADRAHLIALAAIAMRRLLVERARRRAAAKRGGGRVRITLDDRLLAPDGSPDVLDLIAVDEALTALARLDPKRARIVELRVFAGLSVDETAAALSISAATVKRQWTLARAWLWRELERGRAR